MPKKFNLKKRLSDLIASATSDNPAKSDEAPWIKHVALLTGVLAALAGFLTVRTTSLTNDAIYQSNQAILAQSQSSDAWAEYQANSIKARIIETQLLSAQNLTAAAKDSLTQGDNELRARQPQNKETATEKEQERDQYIAASLKRLGEKDILGYAGLAAQVGIALASVAAMSRKRSAFTIAILIALASLGITVYAFIVHGITV